MSRTATVLAAIGISSSVALIAYGIVLLQRGENWLDASSPLIIGVLGPILILVSLKRGNYQHTRLSDLLQNRGKRVLLITLIVGVIAAFLVGILSSMVRLSSG